MFKRLCVNTLYHHPDDFKLYSPLDLRMLLDCYLYYRDLYVLLLFSLKYHLFNIQ